MSMVVKSLVGLALIAVGGWWLTAPQQGGPAVAERAPIAGGGQTIQQSGGASTPVAGATNTAVVPPSASAPAILARPLTGSEMSALSLTRQLNGDHLVTWEDRPHRILGSKEAVDQSGGIETMLVIRDEVSGQLHYRLSGLQFALKPGVDYEAFIREHRAQRRIFVNTLYAQVAVDAAQIAAEFSALSKDDRVARVRFMTLVPVRTPR